MRTGRAHEGSVTAPLGATTPAPLAVTATRGRWVFAVLLSALIPAGMALLGVSPVIAVGLGLLVVVTAVADVMFGLVSANRAALLFGLDLSVNELHRRLVLDMIEGPTHGRLVAAQMTLQSAEQRMDRDSPRRSQSDLKTLARVRKSIESRETAIRNSAPVRGTRQGLSDGAAVLGGLTARTRDGQTGGQMQLYSDPANLPTWVRGPWARDLLIRAGGVLDDVRLLHNAAIEWIVLLFTLWARLILVAAAPLLGAAIVEAPPLEGGFRLIDIPWALAAGCALATACVAPWIATSVMRDDEHGALVRRVLLAIEVPIAIAAILAAPYWPVIAFAAGWTNWWQRPSFSWVKLGLWMVAIAACVSAGTVIAGLGVVAGVTELLFGLLVIAVIGGSYGAMLPISAGALLRVVVGGIITPRRARRTADAQLSGAVGELLEAADVIENSSAPEDHFARRDVAKLREVARELAVRTDAADRWARRVPLGLAGALGLALERAAPMTGTPSAAIALRVAAETGEQAPVTVLDPSFYDDQLAAARFSRRADAKALVFLVTEIVQEARTHGCGPLVTRCHAERDLVVLRFANVPRDSVERPGRGSGAQRLRRMAAALPGGKMDLRGPVDGTFVDLPSAARRFGVQVSFQRNAVQDGGSDS